MTLMTQDETNTLCGTNLSLWQFSDEDQACLNHRPLLTHMNVSHEKRQ